MSFKDQIKNDAVNCFLNGNEFAEDVFYTPQGGTERVIKAIVERRRLTPAGEDSNRVLVDSVEIMIARDAVYGVAVITKGMNADEVVLPEVIGGPGVHFFVADILGQDDGMWHLLLQK
jgi:hypothetical protein